MFINKYIDDICMYQPGLTDKALSWVLTLIVTDARQRLEAPLRVTRSDKKKFFYSCEHKDAYKHHHYWVDLVAVSHTLSVASFFPNINLHVSIFYGKDHFLCPPTSWLLSLPAVGRIDSISCTCPTTLSFVTHSLVFITSISMYIFFLFQW